MLALGEAPQNFFGICFHFSELACSRNSVIPNPSVERLQPDAQWRTGQSAQELFDIIFEVAKAFFDDARHGKSVVFMTHCVNACASNICGHADEIEPTTDKVMHRLSRAAIGHRAILVLFVASGRAAHTCAPEP
jgi:hypothetical protein